MSFASRLFRNRLNTTFCHTNSKHLWFLTYVLFLVLLCRLMYLSFLGLTLGSRSPRNEPPMAMTILWVGGLEEEPTEETGEERLAPSPGVQRTTVPYMQYLESACAQELQRRDASNTTQFCPCLPHGLRGRLYPNLTHLLSVTWETAEGMISGVGRGGHWRPAHCEPRRRVAVIIPYRDRERHLRAFLAHTHPILQRQLLQYKVFIVEQEYPQVFNKGSMMNIGFLVAESFQPDCVLFHDVDLLMENDIHIIVCTDAVQHMGAYIDTHEYRIPYQKLFGGAVLLYPGAFKELNGYSNQYFGWGGEDDDFTNRLLWKNQKMVRAPEYIASYKAITHDEDKGNPRASDRKKGYSYSPDVYGFDGLNNVNYTILETKSHKLYTWIHVRLQESNITYYIENFNSTTYYRHRRSGCDPPPAGPVLELSRVTCLFTCDRQERCVGVYYRTAPNTASFCILMHQYCTNFTASNNTDIYFRPRIIQYLE